MARRFVSEPIEPAGGSTPVAGSGGHEPPVPQAFAWRGERLEIARVLRTWRGLKDDRGDVYLKRHYFELELADGRTAVAYYQRGENRWRLYTITTP